MRDNMSIVKILLNNPKPVVLCLGAHPDDIEIGCGGTICRLIEELSVPKFCWIVFSGNKTRSIEAQKSANTFLDKVNDKSILIKDFRESYFPFVGDRIKDFFEEIKKEVSPDIVFTHYRGDAHQDHRIISELTWNTFRNHFILEYEILKYDGDLSTPNWYALLDEKQVRKKIENILSIFKSQSGKNWFSEETFRSILRIRGVESQSTSNYAEAFYCRKIVF